MRHSDPVRPRELVCKLVHGERRDQTDDTVRNTCGCDDKIFPVDRDVGDRIRESVEALADPLDTAFPAMVGKKACVHPKPLCLTHREVRLLPKRPELVEQILVHSAILANAPTSDKWVHLLNAYLTQ